MGRWKIIAEHEASALSLLRTCAASQLRRQLDQLKPRLSAASKAGGASASSNRRLGAPVPDTIRKGGRSMNRNRVYLAGGINGLSDAECKDWRTEAAGQLAAAGFEVVDPMRRDYRGEEMRHAAQIVYNDLRDIDSCDVMLAKADTPSWGTAMEVYYAFQSRRVLVVAWCKLANPSPWLRMHAHYLAPHLAEAVDFIRLGAK
jgi:nucleoside 2-deoxyribosyltransferase